MRAFADALDAVPMALAENSGLSPIETLANIKSRQAKEKNTRLGVDCMQTGSNGKYKILRVIHSFCYTRFTAVSRVYMSISSLGGIDRQHPVVHVFPALCASAEQWSVSLHLTSSQTTHFDWKFGDGT